MAIIDPIEELRIKCPIGLIIEPDICKICFTKKLSEPVTGPDAPAPEEPEGAIHFNCPPTIVSASPVVPVKAGAKPADKGDANG